MQAYASRTGTRRNLEALRAAGWRLLVSATGCHRHEGFPYAIDNGAWTAHQQGREFDVPAFERVVQALGAGADWIVVPDIVAGGLASLDFSLDWLPRLTSARLLLLAVQDGIEPGHVRSLLGDRLGLFLGGSTAWKLRTMALWGRLSREVGCYFHVARVNSRRRIHLCNDAGAHSFDGTSVTRFATTLPGLDGARRQLGMRW